MIKATDRAQLGGSVGLLPDRLQQASWRLFDGSLAVGHDIGDSQYT